jgi:hypothetical protein
MITGVTLMLDVPTAPDVPAQPAINDDAWLAEKAERIRALGKRAIFEIGRELFEVQEHFSRQSSGDGTWLKWLAREFPSWSQRSGYNFIAAYKLTQSGEFATVANSELDLRSIYLLAAPSTPIEAREEVLGRAKNGERVSHEEVKSTIEKMRRDPPEADPPEADLKPRARKAVAVGLNSLAWSDATPAERTSFAEAIGLSSFIDALPVSPATDNPVPVDDVTIDHCMGLLKLMAVESQNARRARTAIKRMLDDRGWDLFDLAAALANRIAMESVPAPGITSEGDAQVFPELPEFLKRKDLPESKLLAEYRERMDARHRAPRLKVDHRPPNPVDIAPAEGEPKTTIFARLVAFGTISTDFHNRTMHELLEAGCRGTPSQPFEEWDVNGALAAMHGIAPRDEIEGMLAAQMVAVHSAAMRCLRQLKGSETLQQQDSNGSLAVKLLRTYTMQMEALHRRRGQGRAGEHVRVYQGSQAIVGAVHQGGRAREKPEEQPHGPAITPEPGATLPCPDPQRQAIPSPSGER